MDTKKLQNQIAELEAQIEALPKGSVAKKSVNGKTYYYHRYNENGKRTEKYIDFDFVDTLREQIDERKELELKLKELKKKVGIPAKKPKKKGTLSFHTSILVGDKLKKFVADVKNYKKRECYALLHNFVYGDIKDRVFILYGLRRTGKTTMIRQMIADMSESDLAKAAFIQIASKDTLADVNKDMKLLEQEGYKYIFIDEVTFMEDFIEGAALFSDVFATCGMKIVLSGTDSLGFMLSKSEQLYDRCILLHTTVIPYREFEKVLGIKGIDEYIRYGGTMSLGGINYNEGFAFTDTNTVNSYVDSAIAKNIQHSLRYYQDGGHFRHLAELYERNELTNAINRVVEDINHRFTKEVITREFESGDLKRSARNLRRDRFAPNTILDDIDVDTFTEQLKSLLEILDEADQTVKVADVHAAEIKEYLVLLDLIYEVDSRSFPNVNDIGKITVVSQPGMRYAQAQALVKSLLLDDKFKDLNLDERTQVIERILSEIRGRMMEDIILLETKLAQPSKEVFKLQFTVGEFDMVVFDPETASCEIYEIKYSTQVVEQQYQHLVDEQKCAQTEHRFGTIKGKYVLYRGATQDANGIHYVNVEEYLNNVCND